MVSSLPILASARHDRFRSTASHPRRRHRRRPGRADGGADAGRGRGRRRPVRRHALGRAQVPAGRQGRHEPHPCRAGAAFLARYGARARAGRTVAGRLRAGRAARLGARARHRHLRRQLGPRVPDRHEGGAAAARLAASPARGRRAVPHAPSLARLGRPPTARTAALRHARRRMPGARPTPCCWHWAAAVGRGSARTAPGCRCWRNAASRWRRCSRPTAASTSAGARISANASPASR